MSNAAVMLYDGSLDQDILETAESLGVHCIQVTPEYLEGYLMVLESVRGAVERGHLDDVRPE